MEWARQRPDNPYLSESGPEGRMEEIHGSPPQGKKASALGYNPQEGVPRLLAKGKNREAERIIALAQEAGIEIVEDPALAALLDAGVEPGEWIPPWCWEAVAKILAFVFAKERPV